MYEIIEKCVFSLFTCLKWNNCVVQTSHEFMAILHAHQNCLFVIFFLLPYYKYLNYFFH